MANDRKKPEPVLLPGTGPQGQPTPDQVTRVGKGVKLGPRALGGLDSDTIEAQSTSPLVNTWTIVIQPTYSTLRLLAAGEFWGVKMTVQVHHDSANNLIMYRDLFEPTPLQVALVGQAIGVHGQQIRVGMFRADGAEAMTKVIEIEVAIIPGPPVTGNIVKGPFLIGAFSPTALVNIPIMSRYVTVIGALNAGDKLRWVGPTGIGSVGEIVMSDPLLGVKIPILDTAAYIQYETTAIANKQMIFDFETWE